MISFVHNHKLFQHVLSRMFSLINNISASGLKNFSGGAKNGSKKMGVQAGVFESPNSGRNEARVFPQTSLLPVQSFATFRPVF